MTQDSTPLDFTPPEIEEVAALLPAYEILSFIAKGGMGAVYKARQKSLDRDVAIKVLPRHFGADTEFRESFESEAKSMAKFNHPNLIGIYDFGQIDGLLYIIMELVEGTSLYHYAYGQQLEPTECVRIVSDVCMGLASAHDHGILHRDIKPANILLDHNNSPKIGDFGLARPVENHEEDTAFGTPGYTAPEVVTKPSAVDQSTDLFSVGIMLYELLTGQIPSSIYTTATSLVGCDPAYDKIIRKAIHPTPAMRFRSAKEFAKALNAIGKNNALAPDLQANTPANRLQTAPTSGNTARPQKTIAHSNYRSSSSAPAVKSGSNAPFVRNIVIIIGLLAAIYFTWNFLQQQKADRIAEQEAVDAKKLADQIKNAEERKAAREKFNREARESANNSSNTKPKPEKIESPIQFLKRMRVPLHEGKRDNMHKTTVVKGNRARMYISKKMSWHDAQSFCNSHGGYLAVLPNQEALKEISSTLKEGQTVWLGAGSAGRNAWSWVDGTQWSQKIRKTSKASYVATSDIGILQPQPESTKNSFFIEWNMDGTQPASLIKRLKRTATSLTSDQPQFPAGTISYDGRHYLLIKHNTNWKTARGFAEAGQGNLVVPSNADENIWILEFIANHLQQGQHSWIGGFHPAEEQWQWSTGEPWQFAKWQEGAPNEDTQVSSACAANTNHSWIDFPSDKKLPYFIIEWSSDSPNEKSGSPGTTAAESEVTVLTGHRKTCIAQIKKIQAKYDIDFTNNIKGYESEINSYSRSLNKSQTALLGPRIANMISTYPNNRIPNDIPRANMPQKPAKILDSRLNRQQIIITEYTKEIEKLRGQYHAILKKESTKLDAQGLASHSRPLKDEIEATNSAQAFVDYILDAS